MISGIDTKRISMIWSVLNSMLGREQTMKISWLGIVSIAAGILVIVLPTSYQLPNRDNLDCSRHITRGWEDDCK